MRSPTYQSDARPMTSRSISQGTILVGTDGSERAQQAVGWAAREAHLRHTTLTILSAWTPQRLADASLWAVGYAGSRLLEEIRAQQVADAARMVETAALRVRDRYPELDVRTIQCEGDARHALVEHAEKASLLVVGSRGSGPIASVVLGSVAFWLTRHAEVPLAVVPTEARHAGDTLHEDGVIAGVSLDPLSAKVVAVAAEEADRRSCDLILAYCAWDGEASRHGWDHVAESDLDSLGVDAVNELAAVTAARFPQLRIRRRFARGNADRYLADVSAHHEVLVLGRRGASAIDPIGLGSVASAVFHSASCVVLVVPLMEADDEALRSEELLPSGAHVG